MRGKEGGNSTRNMLQKIYQKIRDEMKSDTRDKARAARNGRWDSKEELRQN